MCPCAHTSSHLLHMLIYPIYPLKGVKWVLKRVPKWSILGHPIPPFQTCPFNHRLSDDRPWISVLVVKPHLPWCVLNQPHLLGPTEGGGRLRLGSPGRCNQPLVYALRGTCALGVHLHSTVSVLGQGPLYPTSRVGRLSVI